MSDEFTREPYSGAELPGDAPATPAPAAEPTFRIGEEDMPLSKVGPDIVREWYDAHTNREKWQASNTQKAQEIAEARRQQEEWSKKYPDYEKKTTELDKWEGYLQANPQLREYLVKYAQGDQRARAALEGLGLSNVDPRYSMLEKQVSELRSQMEQRQEQARIDKEVEEAMAELRKDPSFDEKAFQTYFEKATGEAGNTKALYGLVYNAWRGTNVDSVKAEAKAEYVKEKELAKKAGVEKGSTNAAVNLPTNHKVGGGYDEAMAQFFKEKGIPDPDPWES